MLRGLRIVTAQVGLAVTGAVHRSVSGVVVRGRACGCGCGARGRCAGSGGCEGAGRTLGSLILRRSIGAGLSLLVGGLTELLGRLSLLFGSGELVLLSRSSVLSGLSVLVGTRLTRLCRLTRLSRPNELVLLSGRTELSRLSGSFLTRPGRNRAIGCESGRTGARAGSTGHIGHRCRMLGVLGDGASLRMGFDVLAAGEFLGEERQHREHTGEERNERSEERQVRAHMPVDRRGEQVDEHIGEGDRREYGDELVEAEGSDPQPTVAQFVDEHSRHDEQDREHPEHERAHVRDIPMPQGRRLASEAVAVAAVGHEQGDEGEQTGKKEEEVAQSQRSEDSRAGLLLRRRCLTELPLPRS